MSVLHLTLKKKWFDLIASGEKKEEYREIKPYWENRLIWGGCTPKHYDFIIFRNGYSKNAPELKIKCEGITSGNAKPEWSDNWQGEVFIIKLGEIIK